MSGHRHAALALHSLTARDQNLILAELAAPDQDILRQHLAELAELGFDGSPVPQPAAATQEGPGSQTPYDVVQGADAPAMAEILAHEPATLVACLLHAAEWPWATAFLDLLPPPRRVLVKAAMDREPVAATARDRMLIAIAAAALARRPGRRMPVRTSFVSSLFGRIATWKP